MPGLRLVASDINSTGKVAIATVNGALHEIGENLLTHMIVDLSGSEDILSVHLADALHVSESSAVTDWVSDDY